MAAPGVALQPAAATSWAPTAKVAVGALAGAVTLILVQAFGHYGFKLTPEAAGAVTTVITFAIQYMTPERK
jgi:hypothetical protein